METLYADSIVIAHDEGITAVAIEREGGNVHLCLGGFDGNPATKLIITATEALALSLLLQQVLV